MRPRVLFVDHAGVLGGAELSLLDIAAHVGGHVVLFEEGPFRQALVDAGVSMEILPAPDAVRLVSRGGSVMHDVRAFPGVIRHALALAQRAASFDLIYANSQKAMVVGSLAGAIARTPVLWHLRDVMTSAHFSRPHRALAAAVSSLFVRRVIANSRATRHAFVASGGRPSRTFAVPNGIDEQPFTSVSRACASRLRAKLGVADVPVVGMFGRLARWKGQHVLLSALRAHPGMHALFVGDALFPADEPYAASLRQQAEADGLADRVHWLGFRTDVPALMHAVDVVVHASTAPEPFGRVLVEGMLAGRPVVATAAGGAAEILDDGRTGCLVAPGDAQALADALGDLFARPDYACSLAEAGRLDAQRRFSLGAMLHRIDAHIAAVASPPEPTAPQLATSAPVHP